MSIGGADRVASHGLGGQAVGNVGSRQRGRTTLADFRGLLRACDDVAAVMQLIRAAEQSAEERVHFLVAEVMDHGSQEAWQELLEMSASYTTAVASLAQAGLQMLACGPRRDVAIRSVNALALLAPHNGHAIQHLGLVLSEANDPSVFLVAFRTLNSLSLNEERALDPEGLFVAARMFLERSLFHNIGSLVAGRDIGVIDTLVTKFSLLLDNYGNPNAGQILVGWDITTLRAMAEGDTPDSPAAKAVLQKLAAKGNEAARNYLEQLGSVRRRFAGLLVGDGVITESLRVLEDSFKRNWIERITREGQADELVEAARAGADQSWVAFLAVYLPPELGPAEREARRQNLVLVHLIDGELNRSLGVEPLIGRVIARWRDGHVASAKLPLFVDHLIKTYDAYEFRRGNASRPLGSTTLTDFAYTLQPDDVPEDWEWDNGV